MSALNVPMVLCPTCRVAIPDAQYHRHVKECQAKAKARAERRAE